MLDEKMARIDPVDGAIEVYAGRKDLCWECAAQNGFKLVTGLLARCGCMQRCETKDEGRGYDEEVENARVK